MGGGEASPGIHRKFHSPRWGPPGASPPPSQPQVQTSHPRCIPPPRAHLPKRATHLRVPAPRALGWRGVRALSCLLEAARAHGRCLITKLLAPRAARMEPPTLARVATVLAGSVALPGTARVLHPHLGTSPGGLHGVHPIPTWGHHRRGRGPRCGDHSDAPVRPHPPPCPGKFT